MNESGSSSTSNTSTHVKNDTRQAILNEEICKQRQINSCLSTEDKIAKLLDVAYINQFNLNCLNANLHSFIESAERRFKAVESKVDYIEKTVTTNSSTITTHSAQIQSLETKVKEMEEFVKQTKIDTVNKEVHGRRYNLIFGNIKDDGAWETPEKAEKLIRELCWGGVNVFVI